MSPEPFVLTNVGDFAHDLVELHRSIDAKFKEVVERTYANLGLNVYHGTITSYETVSAPDYTGEFKITIDGIVYSIGSVLNQEELATKLNDVIDVVWAYFNGTLTIESFHSLGDITEDDVVRWAAGAVTDTTMKPTQVDINKELALRVNRAIVTADTSQVAGEHTWVQYNNNMEFGASERFTFDPATASLYVRNMEDEITFKISNNENGDGLYSLRLMTSSILPAPAGYAGIDAYHNTNGGHEALISMGAAAGVGGTNTAGVAVFANDDLMGNAVQITISTVQRLLIDDDAVSLTRQQGTGAQGLRWYEDGTNGSNYFEVRAPDALGTTRIMRWPSDAPAVGEVLSIASVTGDDFTTQWSAASTLVAEPEWQVVFGTGTAIDSDPNFTWDTHALIVGDPDVGDTGQLRFDIDSGLLTLYHQANQTINWDQSDGDEDLKMGILDNDWMLNFTGVSTPEFYVGQAADENNTFLHLIKDGQAKLRGLTVARLDSGDFYELINATGAYELRADVVNFATNASNTSINIGTSGTNTILIGNAASTVTILGTVVTEDVTNLNITDKVITLNDGGGVASGAGVGFEIEENAAITGYFKTTGGRDGWLLRAPTWANDISFLCTPLAARSFTFPDASGTVALISDIDELAQDAVGNILLDSTTIDFTYNDGTPSITASVIDASITYAKIQDVSATDRLLGRVSGGSGDIEEIPISDFVQTILDDADAAAVRSTLGLGSLAVLNYEGTVDADLVATVTWTGTTAPSGTPNLRYSWARIGATKLVWFVMRLEYSVAGSALTQVTINLPGDMPNPADLTGWGVSEVGPSVAATLFTTIAGSSNNTRGFFQKDG